MTFDVGVVASFTARHHLVGDFGPASDPHEHRYRVNASVTGSDLLADGTLFDITALDGALGTAVALLDGRDLNELDDLATPNPTAEIVARYVFARVAPDLARRGLSSLSVRVWESDQAYAAYSGALSP